MSFIPEGPAAPAPIRVLGAVVDWSIVAMGMAVVVIVFANVIMHQFDVDIAWTTEFGEFVMVWVTFLGGAAAARRGSHMAITEFVDMLGTVPRRWFDMVLQLVIVAVLVLLIYYGWRTANASWGNVLTVLGWAAAWQYLALPVGSVFTLIFVLHDFKLTMCGVPRTLRYGE